MAIFYSQQKYNIWETQKYVHTYQTYNWVKKRQWTEIGLLPYL